MRLLDIDWVGLTAENAGRLLVSVLFVLAVLLIRRALRWLLRRALGGATPRAVRAHFWIGQGLALATAVVLVFGVVSIWFHDPARLATAFGLVSAGLAFAMQRVITAFAGYVVVLNANVFTVGDRINMGGVRGDVLALGFMQTTLLEMGQTSGGDPGPEVWVHSRQFTGRIVTISNAKVFDEPVYNYTRDFPYIWDEIRVPLRYGDDRRRAEAILLDAAHRHAVQPAEVVADPAATLLGRFNVKPDDLAPRVYYRLTDNWLELTLRFVYRDHGTRAVKDGIAREVLDAFDAAGIAVAAPRRQITALPPVEIRRGRAAPG